MLGPYEAVVASSAAGTVGRAALAGPARPLGRRDRDLHATASSRSSSSSPQAIPFRRRHQDGVPALRTALERSARGELALLGGPAAEAHDAREALRADARLIVPLTLLLVLAIIGLLVRAIVAPLYLVATVVLSYAFALGVSSLLFDADRSGAADVRLRLPRGARRGLQRLPDQPHPRGARAITTPARP